MRDNERLKKGLNAFIFMLMAAGGMVSVVDLLQIASEPGSAFLFGYSLGRLALVAMTSLAIVFFGICAVAALRQPRGWQSLSRLARKVITQPNMLFLLAAALLAAFFSLLAFLVLVLSAGANELVTQRSLFERAGALMVWLEVNLLLAGILLAINLPRQEAQKPFFTPLRLSLLLAIATAIYAVALHTYATTSWAIWLRGQEILYLPAAVGLVLGFSHHFFHEKTWYRLVGHWLLLLFIGVSAYVVYRHTAFWAARDFTTSKANWHLLADAFLHGRLYLEQPASTHDLTFYDGHWYVPNPPLPALVILPLVAMFGADSLNMVRFGITIGAINAVLIYQFLAKASQRKLIPTSASTNLWLTAVAVFGTSHWWLSVMGEMWFTSQLLTLTFLSLAALVALERWSPWLAGLCLGLAVLSRPNAFTLFPFLAGLFLYLDTQEGKALQWQRAAGWGIQAALPVGLAVFGLLYYNHLRFQDWLDFGYVTINSSDWIMEAARTYGMFNAHFIPKNLSAMFLKLPRIVFDGSCLYYSPSREGISLLAMTPALVYVFRRFKMNWWTGGAWASILLSMGLLLFYHNTGADQLGYRYLMDYLLPVLLLMGLGAGERSSWIFKGLVMLSVLGNAAGIYWWFTEWWCKPV